MLKRIHIFTAGKHTDSNRKTREFTKQELRETANSYDPAKWMAPVVIGHPSDNSPKWGGIAGLEFDEASGKLFARTGELVTEFREALVKKLYDKVSASFYPPDHPHNPNPGKLTLRHLGFLGGTPPAIKNLEQFSFADGDAPLFEFSSYYSDSLIANTFARLRDWLIETAGREAADGVIPAHVPADLADEAKPKTDADGEYPADYRDANGNTPDPADGSNTGGTEQPATPTPGNEDGAASRSADPSHTEETPMTEEELKAARLKLKQEQDQLTVDQGKLKTDQTQVASDFAELAATKAKSARQEAESFCDGLIAKGTLKKNKRNGAVAALVTLAAAKPLEFSDGNTTTTVSGYAFLKEHLTGGTATDEESNDFSELTADDGHGGDGTAPQGRSSEEMAAEINKVRREAEANGESLSYSDALARVEGQTVQL